MSSWKKTYLQNDSWNKLLKRIILKKIIVKKYHWRKLYWGRFSLYDVGNILKRNMEKDIEIIFLYIVIFYMVDFFVDNKNKFNF